MAPPGGAPMAPPGGGPMPGGAPMGGGGGNPAELQKQVQTWLILSFVSIICGCGLLGIIPIIFAFQAKSAAEAGDEAGMKSKLQIAKICIIIGWVLFGLSLILNIISLIAAS